MGCSGQIRRWTWQTDLMRVPRQDLERFRPPGRRGEDDAQTYLPETPPPAGPWLPRRLTQPSMWLGGVREARGAVGELWGWFEGEEYFFAKRPS